MEVAEHRFRVMASDAHVIVVAQSDAPSGDWFGAHARGQLDHLEQRWSRFLPDSDITRINVAEGRPVRVDADTVTLLLAMVDAWRLTDGRFDPTVLPALIAAGYGASIDDPERVTAMPAGDLHIDGLGDVHIDAANCSVTLPRGCILDPGGIGKGLAADLTAGRLIAAGAGGALVSVGGDIAMAGAAPHPAGWFVNVEQPDASDGNLCTLAVSGGGVATSSTRSRRWTSAGRTHHHHIDPPTGVESTSDLAAVTVIARSGWLAEAHSTAALLSGHAGVLRYLDDHALTGIAVRDDGSTLVTSDLDRVQLAAPGLR
jgi:thiamine biosynthesis lipoprotein